MNIVLVEKVFVMCLLVLHNVQWPCMWEWCVDGAGVGAFLVLDGRIGLVRVPHTRAWTVILHGSCSPNPW